MFFNAGYTQSESVVKR